MRIFYQYSKLKLFLLFFIASLLLISCEKNNDIIPYVPVNIYISIDPDLANLGVGGSAVYTGGLNGILIYRKSVYEFAAYERTCTYRPSDNCAIEIDETGLIPECPCCGSKFILTNEGSVLEGPAVFPLKQYQTTVTGNILHIHN